MDINELGYKLNKKIAEGEFSNVYSASFKNGKGEVFTNVAVKVVQLWKVKKVFRDKFLPREVEILRNLKKKPHLNIIDIHVRLQPNRIYKLP